MKYCRIDRRGSILIVSLDRPECLNALHSMAHFELAKVFDEFEDDKTIRVGIITGEGDRAFCAGNDLKFQASGGNLERPASGFAGLVNRFHRTKPVIAAVNGLAFGGGCEIVASCDIAISAENATFCMPEVRVGLVSTVGSHMLVRTLGMKNALGLLLTGRRIPAAEALRIGLINDVVPTEKLLESAMAWAREIAQCSPSAVRTTLDIIKRSSHLSSAHEAIEHHYESVDAHRRGSDFLEGPAAFKDKRQPNWED
jgi:enoyl-CoA hydratase/carnithine racemase